MRGMTSAHNAEANPRTDRVPIGPTGGRQCASQYWPILLRRPHERGADGIGASVRPTSRSGCCRLLEPEELPPEFGRELLQIQVLGYRERLTLLHGRRLRVLDPVWTLVPKH